MKIQIRSAVILASLVSVVSLGAQAAVLNNGDILHITSATFDGNGYVNGGSYYGVDMDGDYSISPFEKTPLSEGTTGLVIGAITSPRRLA